MDWKTEKLRSCIFKNFVLWRDQDHLTPYTTAVQKPERIWKTHFIYTNEHYKQSQLHLVMLQRVVLWVEVLTQEGRRKETASGACSSAHVCLGQGLPRTLGRAGREGHKVKVSCLLSLPCCSMGLSIGTAATGTGPGGSRGPRPGRCC